MKALVGAFNQEKALVGALSVIVQPVVEPIDHYTALIENLPNKQLQHNIEQRFSITQRTASIKQLTSCAGLRAVCCLMAGAIIAI